MSIQAIAVEGFKKLTDGELIVDAVNGRVDGFEELVRRYQRPITDMFFACSATTNHRSTSRRKFSLRSTIRSVNTVRI